jgi:uncharacterized repeat protein (TIGR03803 family)
MRNENPQSSVNRSAATIVLILLWVASSSAATEKILHNFSTAPKGANPTSALIADAVGNLYGTTSDGGGYGAVFKLTRTSDGKWIETVLHHFLGPPGGGPDGAYPSSGTLTFDSGGALYGATSSGGVYGNGTVFKMTPTSGKWKETVIHSFAGYPSDGASANNGLIFDGNGNLYGTTSSGGSSNNCGDQYDTVSCGTVFKLSPGSYGNWTEAILYSFQGGTDGCSPNPGLVFDKAGNLYGTTYLNGGNGYDCFEGSGGTVFELAPRSGGWGESIIYAFDFTHGGNPFTNLLLDASGNLYGTTEFGGGCFFCGVVFELSPTSSGGWTETVLYSFTGGSDGDEPLGNLAFDSSGHLYGTAELGGTSTSCAKQGGCGTIFELESHSGTWMESTLYSFTGGDDGRNPLGGVMLDSTGNLFVTASGGGDGGTCSLNFYLGGCGAVLKLGPPVAGKWNSEVLYDFPFRDDGLVPYSNLIADSNGNFYGTTVQGGSANVGTVFQMTKLANGQWKTKVLHNFAGGTGDGGYPKSGLVFDTSGNLYGTTQYYGAGCSNLGCGVVFQLVPTGHGWREKVIYNFQQTGDGANPAAGLVFDASGNMYGTTYYGGDYDGGTVFKLAPRNSGGWKETVIHSFGTTGDGDYPSGKLIVDKKDNLYGTTQAGGLYQGVVFELSPPTKSGGGWSENILHTFIGSDGSLPEAALIFDSDGDLYGTTRQGGLYNAGIVFKLTLGSSGVWTEKALHNFVGVNGDGGNPASDLIFDNSGNLYGTTTIGGIDGGECGGLGCGTAFKLMPDGSEWKEQVLHRFTGGRDGGQPYAGFSLDPAGNLYSTTSSGGVGAQGVVFEITP